MQNIFWPLKWDFFFFSPSAGGSSPELGIPFPCPSSLPAGLGVSPNQHFPATTPFPGEKFPNPAFPSLGRAQQRQEMALG